MGVAVTLAAAATPTIWFCPLDPLVRDTYGGSPEYMDLFAPDAPWQKAAARVNVFKIYPQWIDGATDDQLKIQFADLKRRHIKLAMEFGVLSPTDAWMSEGYGGMDHHLLKAVERIHNDGGTLSYVAMDEPMYFGTVYRTGGMTPLTIKQMVDDAAVNIKEMWTEFPDVQVGDIEPLVTASAQGMSDEELITRYGDGIDEFNRVLGKPLAFFDADLDWHSNNFLKKIAAEYKTVRARDVPYGIIYNGDGSNNDDASWLEAARWHMSECEAAVGTPQLVIFQSWNPNPRKLLPESDQTAFTSLINDYFTTPTRLNIQLKDGYLIGGLSSKQGGPISGATVTATLKDRSLLGTMARYSVTGKIPVGATMALTGVRVNNEGSSIGRGDVRLESMRFTVDGQTPLERTFSSSADLALWPTIGVSPDGATATVEDSTLHIVASSSQALVLNSAPFSIPASGKFRFEVTANVPASSVSNGYFAIFFMGEKGEIMRTMIPFDLPAVTIPLITTGSDGTFREKLPSTGNWLADVQYQGDALHWPTSTNSTGE
jgi:uncharacterized protein (DUF433 family)